jgi:hypothetical protein
VFRETTIFILSANTSEWKIRNIFQVILNSIASLSFEEISSYGFYINFHILLCQQEATDTGFFKKKSGLEVWLKW